MDVITTDYYGKTYHTTTDKLIPQIHVYGIAVQGDKALISPQFDGYDWPGGTFKLGEDTITTLKREFKEETGYDVEPTKLLTIHTSFFHHPKKNLDFQSFLVFYAVKITGGKLSTAGFDDDEQNYAKLARWVKIDQLQQMHHACSIDIANELIGHAKAIASQISTI